MLRRFRSVLGAVGRMTSGSRLGLARSITGRTPSVLSWNTNGRHTVNLLQTRRRLAGGGVSGCAACADMYRTTGAWELGTGDLLIVYSTDDMASAIAPQDDIPTTSDISAPSRVPLAQWYSSTMERQTLRSQRRQTQPSRSS